MVNPLNPPPHEVIDAANLVGRWFEENNLTNWKVGPCASRQALEEMAQRLELSPHHGYDGLYSRNQTIVLQDKAIAKLIQERDEAQDQWRICNAHVVKLEAQIAEAQRQEPVAIVKQHTGSLKDMAIIVWTGEQPPEGTKLYAHPIPSDKDSERYRWLRKNMIWSHDGVPDEITWTLYIKMAIPNFVGALFDEPVKVQLDAAIDAAMEGK